MGFQLQLAVIYQKVLPITISSSHVMRTEESRTANSSALSMGVSRFPK